MGGRKGDDWRGDDSWSLGRNDAPDSDCTWTVPTGSKNAFVRLCLQGLVTFVFRR